MDINQALSKAAALCSVSEKCSHDIRKKLLTWELLPAEADEVIGRLKIEKFIDDRRFANFFVRDKFRFNKWGRIKIKLELRNRGIEIDNIAEAMERIDADEYRQTLADLMKVRLRQEKKVDPRQRFAALVRFGASRGFEADLCYQTAAQLVKGALGEDD